MPTDLSSSPNGKGKPFHFSHTKLSTFRRCLQNYHWKYIDSYYPPPSSGQARGTAGHAALAIWHTDYDPDTAMNAAWAAWELNMGKQGEEWDLLENALTRYFRWSLDQKDTFKVIKAEHEFEIEFMTPPYKLIKDGVEQKYDSVVMTGFIDGVVEEKGQLWLLENKFFKRMDNTPLDLDPQVSMYLLAEMLLGEKVQGVIYNIVRVANTKVADAEPAVRRRLFRNPEGLTHIQEEMLRQVAQMIRYQQGGTPYRNQTKDCHWDCPFYGPCLLYTDGGAHPTDQLLAITQIRSKNAETETTPQVSEEW